MNQIAEQIRQYILSKNPEISTLDNSTDIFEQRLIDSLQFVEFILHIQEISGVTIEIETIDIDNFRTIDALQAYLNSEMESAIA